MKVVTFRLAWRHGAPELHMATALDKSHALSRCFPLRRNEQSFREVEQMRQARSGNKLRLGPANMTK